MKFNDHHKLHNRRGGTRHTTTGWRVLYNMRQVEIDTLNLGILGDYCFYSVSHATTNVNHRFQVLKTTVYLKHIFLDYSSLVVHSCVENLVEPRVQASVLKGVYSMDPVKCNSSFKNRVF